MRKIVNILNYNILLSLYITLILDYFERKSNIVAGTLYLTGGGIGIDTIIFGVLFFSSYLYVFIKYNPKDIQYIYAEVSMYIGIVIILISTSALIFMIEEFIHYYYLELILYWVIILFQIKYLYIDLFLIRRGSLLSILMLVVISSLNFIFYLLLMSAFRISYYFNYYIELNY